MKLDIKPGKIRRILLASVGFLGSDAFDHVDGLLLNHEKSLCL